MGDRALMPIDQISLPPFQFTIKLTITLLQSTMLFEVIVTKTSATCKIRRRLILEMRAQNNYKCKVSSSLLGQCKTGPQDHQDV